MGIPITWNSLESALLSTESNAVLRSMYAAYSGCLYSRLVCEMRLRVKTQSAVERPGVNPLCSLLRFCSMVDFMRLRNTCANVFPGTDKRVIPR